jgi:hypothetical protein
LDLVIVSVEMLGFSKNSSLSSIYMEAKTHGLSLCPPELGFLLWLKYPKLLNCGEEVHMAMEPIGVWKVAGILVLVHDDEGKWLSATHGGPKSTWGKHRRFLFVRT